MWYRQSRLHSAEYSSRKALQFCLMFLYVVLSHFLHSILCPCVFLWYIWRKPLHYANIMSEEVPQLCPCTYFSPIITFSISVHWSLKEEIKTNRQNVVFSIFLGSSLMRSICEIYLDCKYVTLRIHGNNPLVYCSAATALTWAEILCNQ